MQHEHRHLERPLLAEPGSSTPRAERAWRQQALLMLAVVALLALLGWWYWQSTSRSAEHFDPPTLAGALPASAAQQETFATLIHDATGALLDARRSGDTSALAEYFANDPAVDTWPDCAALLATHGDEVARRLGNSGDGLLSCHVASVIDEWEYAVARATADQLTPPQGDGMTPQEWMRRQAPAGSIGVRIEEARVSGDGQRAIVTWVSQTDASMHAALRRMDDRWYVVASWNDCVKDGPCG